MSKASDPHELLAEVKRLASARLGAARLAAKHARLVLVDGERLKKLEAVFEMGLQLYNLARRIGKYCDDETNETTVKTLNWLLEFPVAGIASKALSQGVRPKTIIDAITRMKPIRLSAEIAQ